MNMSCSGKFKDNNANGEQMFSCNDVLCAKSKCFACGE